MTDEFTMTMRLCDDDGMVSDAAIEGDPETVVEKADRTYFDRLNRLRSLSSADPYEGGPFPCTGSAHLAGEHIRCTSKAHRERVEPSAKVKMNADGYRLVRIAKEFREWLADAPPDDEDVRGLREDIDAIERIGRWLAVASPIEGPGRPSV